MRIAVLMGGPSAEREISIKTGRAVSEALRRLGHEVIQVDPTPEDFAGTDRDDPGPGVLRPATSRWRDGGAAGHLSFLALPDLRDCEAAFIALHGELGEDGRIQAALDLAGLPYTGSGALASALSMNKDMSKKIFVHHGIPTPKWICGSASSYGINRASAGQSAREADPSEIEDIGGFPIVVKPNNQGSTIGLTVVQEAPGLADALRTAAEYSDRVVLEKYIPGRELTVSILDGAALPVLEIVPEGGLYDYTRKYVKGKSRYVVPAELGDDLAGRVRELGLRAFNALGCRGFGRVDFRLSPENEAFCLEVNTVPGMTETSLVPMAAGAENVSFDQLVSRILASAGNDGPHWRGK